MSATAKTKYVRISPRKARLAADLIRGLPVADALLQLQFGGSKASRLILKTLKSALANAETQDNSRPEELVVAEIRVDEGPRWKRAVPRNRGGRHPILKRTSHFTIKLEGAPEA